MLENNARERGDKTTALKLAEQAYLGEQDPSMRFGLGIYYASDVIEAAPADETRLKNLVHELVANLVNKPQPYIDSGVMRMQRFKSSLHDWNKSNTHQAAVKEIQDDIAQLCAKLPDDDPKKATCQALTTS